MEDVVLCCANVAVILVSVISSCLVLLFLSPPL